jgi:colanic acid biosynthesis protein WcaH
MSPNAELIPPMKPPEMLDDGEFGRVVRSAPLVAIDLIIRDHERNVLVGFRTNEPAKDYYFVPGGCVRKGEPLKNALERIAQAETGYRPEFKAAVFLGVYEHMYPNNRFGDREYGTHYVVLGYELNLDYRPAIRLDPQHSSFRWMSETELRVATSVHPHTKAYFET